ncbi:MAG TPA: SPOR domain-containing protein [Edaphobacter sp.]|nr:SPOR domain-containing protein [Edaphobacter sp.]
MNSRYLEEDDDLDTGSADREISLSPSTLLGIFFLLAIICAIFFGFGYSMGHRSALAATQSADSETAPLKASSETKPAPGLANSSASLTPADAAASQPADESASDDAAPVDKPAPAPKPHLERASAPQAAPQLKPAVAVKTPAPTVPVSRSAATGPAALVQVAAVSHQEDADILASALKRKGYTVAVRHEPTDKLLHIQLGPFANRKEAEVMKQRLSADGYNAIVK